MSFRFFACAGPEPLLPRIEARLADANDLVLLLRTPGFRFWAAGDAPCLFSEDGPAALVGVLIERGTGRRLTSLPAEMQPDKEFVATHWGAYALVRHAGGALTLFRDPSGTVPVFDLQAGSLHMAGSSPDLIRLARDQPLQPDLRFVRHWLSFPFLRTERTGVLGVREILPGRVADGAGATRSGWSPWDHAGPVGARTFDEAADPLRQAVLDCVPAILPDGGAIAVQLSGGLDSSIVGAALAHAGRSFTAVTFATRSADGDERRYARAAASRFGVQLVELMEEDAAPDFTSTPPLSFRPLQTPLLRAYRRLIRDHLRASGTNWAVTGAGGDNLFASLSSAAPAIDALRCGGLRAAATAIGDLAAIHNATRWHVAGLSLRRMRRPQPRGWRRDDSFLTPDAALPQADAHPWLEPPPGTLPGKAEHVRSLVGIQHFLDQDEAGAGSLFPLLSQPLLELCLSIPTHFWIAGGRDRAVARAAFQGLVPDAVLTRRGKGRLESMFMRGYMAGRSQIEALLLDGQLRAEGLVDTRAISAYLRQPGQPQDAGYTRLLEIAAAETWLRSLRA
jgi:asparagine synthase (glutamine-hydrolysing)